MKIIQPLEDRVLVKPDSPLERTETGIIIPDGAKLDEGKVKYGVVKLVGPGLPDKPMTVLVDDHIAYGQYTGTPVESEGEEYLMMRESDIICVIVNPNASE